MQDDTPRETVQVQLEVEGQLIDIDLPIDCYHHLRNVWTGATSKNLCKHMKVELAEDLKEIDYHLHVDVDMGSIIRSVHKLFCLWNNYPKGDGDSFKSHMEEYHPEQLLRHVESTNGNRQDILTVCAGPIYFNARFCMEYLDKKLAALGKNNILEENVAIMLGSTNVLALLRAHAIYNEAITIPIR